MKTQKNSKKHFYVFDEENNIKRIILDLQKQTYQNIEIIHVDNNSTDNSKKILFEFKDKRIFK